VSSNTEDILLKLSLDNDTDMMELTIINNTVEGSRADNLLSPFAMGISVILEDEPSLLYQAGTELYDGDVYVDMKSTTQH